MVSTSYPRDEADWRGVFIRHLVAAVARARQIEVHLWAPPGPLPNRAASAALPKESKWLGNLMSAGGVSHLLRSGKLAALTTPIRLLLMIGACYRRSPNIDVYHINWLQCAIPLPANGKPALITVLGNDLKLLRLPLMRRLLRHKMRDRNVTICPNGDWMKELLEESFGDLASIIPVSFGIDPDWYAIDRQPAMPKRWLAVTRLTADKLGPLFEWSEPLFRDKQRELHLFGPMQEKIQVPSWIHYHGSATPAQLASKWFPSAYGLITLSRHAEGRPQVMLEAMASGLPIIASQMPAHSGIVQDQKTGRLCNSSESYAAALEELENPATNKQYGEAARHWVSSKMGTWDDCAQRYITIYRQLLGVPNA
jgi:glycosyltransferase involved in cell wall biosynthesis